MQTRAQDPEKERHMERAPEDLTERIRSGDTAAIEQAYDAFFTPVMNFIYYTIYDYEAARDISQDAFLKVVEAVKNPRKDVQDFKSYLFATARNMAMDEAKRAGRHREYSPETLQSEDPNIFADPSKAALLNEQRAQVATATSKLNEHQRTALALKDVSGWSYDDIGRVMGLSRNAVGVLLSRARLKFRKEFRLQQVDVDRLADRCRDLLPLMCAVIDGEATERERSLVDEHLRDCPECRAMMEEMAGASATLRSLVPLAPVFALKAALVVKAAGLGAGAAAGAAAAGAGLSVATKVLVGTVASLLVAGAGVGTYLGVKKAVAPAPAPYVRITVPSGGETLQRPLDAQGLATVKVMMEVDNQPQSVELSIDGEVVRTFQQGPYTYTWKTDRAGAHTLEPTALDGSGKRYPGPEVAFTLALLPTSERLAFIRDGDIWVTGLDGSGAGTLTARADVTDFRPSTDGRMIAFTTAGNVMFVMNADGTSPRQATPDSYGLVQYPAFSPDARYVYYIRTSPEDMAKRDGAQDYSIRFERYDLSTGGIDLVYEKPGLFESEGPAGLLAGPDGATLYFTLFTGQYPGSEAWKLALGSPASESVLYEPVRDSGDIRLANWILMSVNSDGGMISCMEEAQLASVDPGNPSAYVEYVCLRPSAGGQAQVIGTNEPGVRKAGEVDAVEWSPIDPSAYYLARVEQTGANGDTLVFYRGVLGAQGETPTGLSISGVGPPKGMARVVWRPLAAGATR
ncbi:MAG: sigma-70 family RNA polymerase sigma factor [Actinomycetota bacterium]